MRSGAGREAAARAQARAHARVDATTTTTTRSAAALGLAALALLGCKGAREPTARGAPPPRASARAAAPTTLAEAAPAVAPCPTSMQLVDTTYCAEPELECLDKERNKANNITICNRFAERAQTCKVPLRRQRFCIDRYEHPSEEGAHPPVMVSWHDASALCEERGKRLCWESEWVAACEGPKKTPFPYGYVRDKSKCNIDNPWVVPSLERLYSRDAKVAGPELTRLDQSVPSGGRPGCVSGFGVYDLTGNLDEWVNADPSPEQVTRRSKHAGLKGGAWGHVRNACRPMTTSHEPAFTYYFVSFRCCADARGAAPPADGDARDVPMWAPPPAPKHTSDVAREPFHGRGFTPTERGPHRP